MAVGTLAAPRPESAAKTTQDTKLNKLAEKWATTLDKVDADQSTAGRSWMELARHVRDRKSSKEQIVFALVTYRRMTDRSAKVEASRLVRFQRSKAASNMLDRALSGDESITMEDLRSALVQQGKKAETSDPAVFAEKKLIWLIKYGLKNGLFEDEREFIGKARIAWKIASEKFQASVSGNGDLQPEQEEDLIEEEA